MDYCPLGRLAKNLKLLEQFGQTSRVTILLSDWIRSLRR